MTKTELERWLRGDATCRRLTRNIRSAQAALRRELGDDAWRLYLTLEEAINARHLHVVDALQRRKAAQSTGKSVATPRRKRARG